VPSTQVLPSPLSVPLREDSKTLETPNSVQSSCDLQRPDTRLPAVLEAIRSARPFALLTVVATDGSTPAGVGAHAMVMADGSIRGTVGGGWLEAVAQRRAVEAIRSGRPLALEIELQGATTQESQPLCGGRVRLIVDPTAERARATYEQALRALTERQRGLWITRSLDTVPREACEMYGLAGIDSLEVTSTFVRESDLPSWRGDPGAEALRACLATEKPALFRSTGPVGGPATEVFVDPLIPTPRLLIVGAGHVGQAVSAQASLVGFEIVVLDDRPEFARPDTFPREQESSAVTSQRKLRAFRLAGIHLWSS